MEKKQIMDFLKRHVWTFLSGLFCLSALIFFLSRFEGLQKTKESDFIAAKKLFDRIWAQESLSKDTLESACNLLSSHPELLAQYQGPLSLALAQSGFTEASENSIKEHLNRSQDFISPHHKEFITIGFLISQNQKQTALMRSLALEEELEKEGSYRRLRDFNLLRISFLTKESKQNDICQSAFQKLSKSPFYSEIQQLFSEDGFSLQDFFR